MGVLVLSARFIAEGKPLVSRAEASDGNLNVPKPV
jgi:hypothetical protein